MRFKKILSAFLAAAVAASSLSIASSAQTAQEPQFVEDAAGSYQASGDVWNNGNFTYTELSDGTYEIKCYSIYQKEITTANIPSTFGGKNAAVTKIAANAFQSCTGLTSVTIPNTVKSIGDYAFSGCTKLNSVTMPNSVTSIGKNAFENCKALTSITISSGVTSIGSDAFAGCAGITSITIPASVTSISDGAFRNCASLTTINVDANNQKYCSVDGVLFSKDKTTLIQYPAGKTTTSYSVPGSVTSVGYGAFYGCTKLTSVTMPNSVKSVGDSAFYNCTGLTSATLPNSLTKIGNNVFRGCKVLTSAAIPSTVTSIGEYAFSGCTKLTPVTIPSGVTSIGGYAFENCSSITSISIPSSVKSIGNGAFCYTKISSVTIPSGITSINTKAFDHCTSLKSVTIPSTVTSIGENAFNGCKSMTTVTLPNNLTSIGNLAFSGTGITSIAIPNSVKSFGSAFSSTSITSVTIPNSVTSIDADAFSSCTKLTSVTIPNGVKSIGANAFNECSILSSVTIPDSVTSIGNLAFYSCTGLKDVYYTGTEAQWKNITIGTLNSALTNATIHYNFDPNLSNLKAEPSSTSVKLTWDKNASASYYKVQIWMDSVWSDLTKTADNTTVTYTASSLTPGTTYKFRVIAYSSAGKLVAYSDVSTKTTGTEAISNLKATPSSTSVKLTWDKNTSAAYYKVQILKGSTWTVLTTTTNNTTVTYTASGLTANTSYTFRVSAYNSAGTQTTYSDVSTKTTSAEAISNLKATPSSTSVKLTWDKNTSAAYYKVQILKGSTWTVLTTTTNNTTVEYTASSLTPNTSYSFRVSAYNSAGTQTTYSDVTATTKYGTLSNLKAASTTSSSVTLNWDKNTSAAYYKVQIQKDNAWMVLTTTANNTTVEYTASSLTPNTSYSFRVSAYSSAGTEIAYSTVTATTKCGTISSLKASSTTSSSVKLSWDKNASAGYYRVQLWKDNAWTNLTKTANNTTVTYTASGLTASTSYKFRVIAYSSAGKMLAYSDITAKTSAATATVSNLKVASTTSSSVKLSWDKNASAGYYRVQLWKDNAWTNLTKTANNTTVTYTASGLTASTSYKFRVIAYSSAGKMLAYSDITAKTSAATATVSNLKATPSTNSVKLTWDKNASAGYYRVQIWKNNAWTNLTKTANNTTVTYTASGLAASTSYKFRVIAYSSAGKMLAYSDITAKTSAATPTISNLKIASTTSSSVKLSWDKNASAGYYRVQIWKNNAWTNLTKTSSNATVTYTASGLAASTSYKFRVIAYSSAGKLLAYSDITAKTSAATPTISNLKVASKTSSSVKLSWNKNTSAGYYRVQLWNGSAWTNLTKTANNTTVSYTASGLKANTSYKFRVIAYSSAGKLLAYSDITAKTSA